MKVCIKMMKIKNEEEEEKKKKKKLICGDSH